MANIILFLAILLTGLHLVTCLIVMWRLRRPAPRVAARPFITLLRPVCGLDRFDAETLASSFAVDWPAYEVIFCAAHADDPAVPLVRDLIAAHRHVPARLLIGDDRPTGNPKLNNLAKGWALAKGDRIVMADANLMLPRDYFDRLIAVEGADTGLVSSPAIGTAPEGLWGALECAFLNGNQARLQLCADEIGQGFAQGKTLMWQRPVLERAGGLSALGRSMAEDVASTKAVRGLGLRVRLSHAPFAQPVGRRSLHAVWSRQVRWSKVRRDGFPGLFLLEPLNGAALPVLMATAALGPWAGLAVGAVYFGSEWTLCRLAGWPAGRFSVAAMILRDALMPFVWLATFTSRTVEWRGNAVSAVSPAMAAE